ncbi:hypothetical protein BUE80_DR009523 [Diplocarpon rosae]|nr:hypothetical protein BUE80_DR009523 [Diplocarpon rosae]
MARPRFNTIAFFEIKSSIISIALHTARPISESKAQKKNERGCGFRCERRNVAHENNGRFFVQPPRLESNAAFKSPAFEQPGSQGIELEQPPAVRQLRSILINKMSAEVIPYSLQPRLRASDPDQFQVLGPLFEKPTILHPASYTDSLWAVADKIYNEARRCHDNHLDESAWMKVVNNVLDSTELGEDTSMLRVHSIHTQSVDPIYLPKHISQSFAKKADLALAFSCDHPSVAAAVEPVQKANPDLCLSQMTDAYTSTVPLACCLEVKEGGGDYNEAILQLGIWCAAGLERLRGLRTLAEPNSRSDLEEELPPFLGWTIVGHDWKLHISWKDEGGNVHDGDKNVTISMDSNIN